MKGIFTGFVLTTLLVFCGLFGNVYAQENTGRNSQLTVPWEEFKKLLNLDEDQIVLPLETFQKLLAQTGVKVAPPHTVKEGNVVLTRAEFKKLVDNMKPPSDPAAQPPFNYLITKAIYSGKMQNDNSVFVGTFTIHVLKKDIYLKVPLLPQSVALEDITVDGKQALVVIENGYHNVVLSQAGEYEVSVSFSQKSSLEKGPHKVDLAILETPITLLNLEIPLKNIDVEIPQAQQILASSRGNTTNVSAVIASGRAISVRWRKQVAVTEKIPPKLYSEVYHLISIDDDALKINSDINYNILHSEVDAVKIAIPEGVNVLQVSGEGVGEWQEVEQQGQRVIMIPFTYGKKGAVKVYVTTETPLSEGGLSNIFSGIQVLETVRETGFIGIELNTSAEVIVPESEGLEKIAVQKLPVPLLNKSAKPLIMGFKYLKHPYSLVLDVKKHEKVAVPVATINSANAVTLFTEDGKVVHRLVYQIRNSAKQFLEIQLPEKADVWSVFVSNQPVESSINGEGKLLVPLIRSRSEDNRLHDFPVEVIYALAQNRFSSMGSLESGLPAVDLMISQLIWSVYLPNDYSYIYFESTLEKEEIIRGLNVFSGAQRNYNEEAMRSVFESKKMDPDESRLDKLKNAYGGKDYGSNFRNVPLAEDQIATQLDAELEFGGRLEGFTSQEVPQSVISGGAVGTGVLPVQIKVPTGGQVYRFARTVIQTGDPLTFSVVYAQLWVSSFIKWLIFVLIILILFLFRKKLTSHWQWLKEKLNDLVRWYKKNESTITKYSQSLMTTFVLIGLVMVLWPFSTFFTILFLFLFWVSATYQILQHRRRKAQQKPKPKIKVKEERAKK